MSDLCFPLDSIGNTKPLQHIERIIKPESKSDDLFTIDSIIETIHRIKNDLEKRQTTEIITLDNCFRIIQRNLRDDKENLIIKQLQNNENFGNDLIYLFISFSSKIYIPSLCELLELISSYNNEISSTFFSSNSWDYFKERFENPDEILTKNLFINSDDPEKQKEIEMEAELYLTQGTANTDLFKYMFEGKDRRTIKNSILGLIQNLTCDEIFDFQIIPDIFNSLIEFLSNNLDNNLKYEIINTLSVVLKKIILFMKQNQNIDDPQLISLFLPIQDIIIDLFNDKDPFMIKECANLFKIYILTEQIDEKSEQILMKIIDFLKTECEEFNQIQSEKKIAEEEEEENSYFYFHPPSFNNSCDNFNLFDDARKMIYGCFVECFKTEKLKPYITDMIDWSALYNFVMNYSQEKTNDEKDSFVLMICNFYEIDPANNFSFISILPNLIDYFDTCTSTVIQESILISLFKACDDFLSDAFNILLDHDFLGRVSSLSLISGKNALIYAQMFNKIYDYVHSSSSKESQYSYAISDISTLQEIIEEAENDEDFNDASDLCSQILSHYDKE